MTTYRRGDRVTYVPGHAHGDPGHPDCEHGQVSSIGASEGTVFVKFDRSIKRFGWDGSTAQGCDPETLIPEQPPAEFVCPACHWASWNQNDGMHRYCGRCNQFFRRVDDV